MTSTEATIVEISRSDLLDLSTHASASITNVKHLSSYNWLEAAMPTIIVPGSPPLWSPPTVSRRLTKDSGLIYIAQNAARHPDSPLEPLFRALYVTDPSYDIRAIDVVSDRNNIRKLLSYINPSSTRNGFESFTINVEVTKDTAIFCRMETATHEFIGPHDFRGFGHEFEKANTKSQISDSTGHHRIISYSFGNLNFLVRFETDGYVGGSTRTTSLNGKRKEDGNLTNILGSLSLSSTTSRPSITPAGSKLTIREEGEEVPLESTLEIKTRVSHKPLQFHEVAPQLWVSQTPKLVRAYHIRGMFQRSEIEDVTAQLKRWEEDNQKDLRKLAALIGRILSVVRELGGNAVIKYDNKRDKLVVSKADGKKMLPKDLYSKWDDVADSKAAETDEHATRPDVKVEGKEGVRSMETKGKSGSAAPKEE